MKQFFLFGAPRVRPSKFKFDFVMQMHYFPTTKFSVTTSYVTNIVEKGFKWDIHPTIYISDLDQHISPVARLFSLIRRFGAIKYSTHFEINPCVLYLCDLSSLPVICLLGLTGDLRILLIRSLVGFPSPFSVAFSFNFLTFFISFLTCSASLFLCCLLSL